MKAEQLRSALAAISPYLPALSPAEEAALAAHLALLLQWNSRINLTAVRDFAAAARKHVGESLFLAAHIPEGAVSVCDIGSGGGYPGIPVAIIRPECRMTLVESDVRKGVFLREASRRLGNVRVVTSRFENVEAEFDWLISRAVNLAGIRKGPESDHAAVLGGQSIGDNSGIVSRYTWTKAPVPWERGSYLWLGNVSRET